MGLMLWWSGCCKYVSEHGKGEVLIIVPLYEGKGSRSEFSSYRGTSLLRVPGNVYGRILTERLMEVTEENVSEDQGGFRKGRGCINTAM